MFYVLWAGKRGKLYGKGMSAARVHKLRAVCFLSFVSFRLVSFLLSFLPETPRFKKKTFFFLGNPRCRAPLDNSCFCYTEKKWVEAVPPKHFTTLLVLALKKQPQSCKKLCWSSPFLSGPAGNFYDLCRAPSPRCSRRGGVWVLAKLRSGRTAEISAF